MFNIYMHNNIYKKLENGYEPKNEKIAAAAAVAATI